MNRIHIHRFRHFTSTVLLLTLDFNRWFRRRLDRAFLRTLTVLLGLLLAAIVLLSLTALMRITGSVNSLIVDTMVGVESSVSMRSAMRETRLDVLHLRLESNLRISEKEVTTLQRTFGDLLQKYRAGAFEPEDRRTAEAIEREVNAYVAALQPLVENAHPADAQIEAADMEGDKVLDLVEVAYEYNRARLHVSANEANTAARQALLLSKRLWWGFAVITGTMVLIYFAYRWLALPEEDI